MRISPEMRLPLSEVVPSKERGKEMLFCVSKHLSVAMITASIPYKIAVAVKRKLY